MKDKSGIVVKIKSYLIINIIWLSYGLIALFNAGHTTMGNTKIDGFSIFALLLIVLPFIYSCATIISEKQGNIERALRFSKVARVGQFLLIIFTLFPLVLVLGLKFFYG